MEVTQLYQSKQILENTFDNNDPDYQAYILANIKRDEELIRFINEFINSEEFHLVKSYNKCKAEKNSEANLTSECWEKVDLIKRAQKIWAAGRRFEKYLKRNANKIKQQQEKGIRIIRDKIAEAKAKYLCHIHERKVLKEERRQEVLHDLKKYGVDTSFLTSKSKVVDKVLVYYKVRHTQRKQKNERLMSIIQKIINEFIRQEQIDKLRSRRYDAKVIRREKLLKNMEILGTTMKLIPPFDPTTEIGEQRQSLKIEEIEETKEEIKKKAKATKTDTKVKDQLDKNPDKGKQAEKKEKVKETKQGKNKEKKEMDSETEKDLVLPYIPPPKRHKIEAENNQKMEDLISDFQTLKLVGHEREQYEEEKDCWNRMFHSEDPSFGSYPKNVIFQGFRNGTIYRKRLKIYNRGNVEKKCRFDDVILDAFYPILIEVEPVGVQTVVPGMCFNVTITFTPEKLEKAVNGNIVFVTYRSSKNEYLQISVPVSCIPWCSQINVTPEAISFDPLPIWKAKRICDYNNFKILKFTNTGNKPCRIIISKIRDILHFEEMPFDASPARNSMDAETSELAGNVKNSSLNLSESAEESDIISKEMIDGCVENIFNSFTFSSNCFNVDGHSERRIKVFFKNVDHVGFYNEKHLISVYEEYDHILSCVSNQVRLITLLLNKKDWSSKKHTKNVSQMNSNSSWKL